METFILSEDNDPKHISRLCKGYLTKKQSDGVLRQMTWPPQSPDLNPIEMVWGELDRRVKAKGPTTAKHLWELLQDCCKTIPGDYLLKLIKRMPKVQIQRIDNKNLTEEEKSKNSSRDTASTMVPSTTSQSSGASQSVTQQNYTIPESGIITIEFPLLQSVQYVNVNVSYQNATQLFYFDEYYWINPSIHLQISETVLKVVANGTIVSAGKNKTTFSLTPDQSWTPTAQLVVYFLSINSSFGDIVQNTSQVFSVKSELGNKVTLSWSKSRANPLENVTLSISVKETRSLVGLQVFSLEDRNNINITSVSIHRETADLYLKAGQLI
ncbi:unnamed protein product [Ranitomeya imitator]|uniref:Alpha-2-macroglobulin bait region domain-containing protein n=1 Tax=Ranitomeya imitator TaxID=111125 RepID=A0ABN9M6F2_9NEOB|nr:unnamed protein product [Ranitomeya imitator]